MNRKPTTHEAAYAWHTATMAHIAKNGTGTRTGPAITEDVPHCGWFMRRTKKDGAYVPCRIWIEPGEVDKETGDLLSPEKMLCEVDGRRQDVASQWTWLCGKPISEDQYFDMIAGNFASFAEPEKTIVSPEAMQTYAKRAILNEAAPLQTDDLPDPEPQRDTGAGPKTMF